MKKKKRTMPAAWLWWIIPASWVVLITTQNILFRPPSAEEMQEWAKFLTEEAQASEYHGPSPRYTFYYSWDCSGTPAWRDDDYGFGAAVVNGKFKSFQDRKKPDECADVFAVVAPIYRNTSPAAGPFKRLVTGLLDWAAIGNRGVGYVR